MVWNELKRTVAREVPRTKQELQDCILRFWSTQMTAEKCATYIDHVFKVVPVCILMRGSATGDVPGKLFNERSRGKSIAYFQGRLADPDIQKKAASFVSCLFFIVIKQIFDTIIIKLDQYYYTVNYIFSVILTSIGKCQLPDH